MNHLQMTIVYEISPRLIFLNFSDHILFFWCVYNVLVRLLQLTGVNHLQMTIVYEIMRSIIFEFTSSIMFCIFYCVDHVSVHAVYTFLCFLFAVQPILVFV